tara:strand:- start:2746 stop:2883 length:138 start_codon:yes stop_codon:yes gene_type:complete
LYYANNFQEAKKALVNITRCNELDDLFSHRGLSGMERFNDPSPEQ